VLTLGALIAIGPLTIDTFLPAFPSLTADLETTSAAVQLTLTGTLIGLALGQLAIGPLSDAIGRKRPLVAGIAFHVLASVLCVIAPNILVLGALLSVAAGTGLLTGLTMVIIAATGAGGLVALMLPMWGTLASASLILSNAPALALSRHGENAGAAAAMLGAVQFGVGAVTAPLVGLIGDDGLAMASVVAGSMAAAFIALIVGVRPWRLAEPDAFHLEVESQPEAGFQPVLGRESAALLVGDDQRGHRDSVEALSGLR
jgi:MFS family permease